MSLLDNRYLTLNRFVEYALKLNNQTFIDYAIRRGYTDYNNLLYQYAKLGNIHKVIQYLNITGDYNIAAEGSLVGNHKDLFDYIYSMNPNFLWENMRKISY